jgi:hypothetical protein
MDVLDKKTVFCSFKKIIKKRFMKKMGEKNVARDFAD